MEGVMTGIKPRESFSEKGISDDLKGDLGRIQQRVNLIDAISGAGSSPLGNPLTQFLLQTGQNLIGGTAAGGTKLQELVGATRDPLNKAVAAQERRDAGRRKLAATMLSKIGGDDIAKIRRNAKKIANATGRDENTVFNNLLNKFMYQDEKSPGTILQQEKTAYKKALLRPDPYGRTMNPEAATAITNAYFNIRGKEGVKLDNVMFNIPEKELAKLEPTTAKMGGKDRKAFKPSSSQIFQDGFMYYDVRGGGKYLIFDEEQNALIPLK